MTSRAEDLLGAWAEFFVAHALSIREIEFRIKGIAPLSLDEYDLLLTLSRQPQQRMRFKALGEATIYTKSGISRIVARMEGAGYLARTECAEDKRGTFAVLTEEGKKALRETWKHYSQAVIDVFGERLSHADARHLSALLGKVVEGLRPDSLVEIGRSCSPAQKKGVH